MNQETTKTVTSEDLDTEKITAQVDAVVEAPLNIEELSSNLKRVTLLVETLRSRMSRVEQHVDLDDDDCFQCEEYEEQLSVLKEELGEMEYELDAFKDGKHPSLVPCELSYLLASFKIVKGRRCWCPERQITDTHPHTTLCSRLQNIYRFDPAMAVTLRKTTRP